MVTFSTIAAAWFGLFSVYLFSAHTLPGYRPSFAKSVFTVPIYGLAVGVAFAGFYMAWISDSVTLRAFNALGIRNTGIADLDVQIASFLLTVMVAISVLASFDA
jgi:hypothetical protein